MMTIKDFENERQDLFWFIDFDCTLVKSLDPIVKELNKRYNKNVKKSDIRTWNFREIQNDLTDDDIEDLFALPQFFKELEFYDGAKEFLLSHKDNCIIVTKGTNENLYRKRIWLNEQGLKDVRMIGLPLNVSKSFINMVTNDEIDRRLTVFVDDSTKNLRETNADVKIQFREFDQETEWNSDWNGRIATSWK